MFFKKFIEQHRVDLLIANGFGLPFWIAAYQIGIHFGYFFCDETKGYGLGGVVLLMIPEAHWSERVDRFTSVVHRTDVMFVSARGDVRPAESAAAIYGNLIGVGSNNGLHSGVDVADIATVAHIRTTGSDSNNVISRDNITARAMA